MIQNKSDIYPYERSWFYISSWQEFKCAYNNKQASLIKNSYEEEINNLVLHKHFHIM